MGVDSENPPQHGDSIDNSTGGGASRLLKSLHNLDRTGWQSVTIQEMISTLVQQPPMMEVFIENEDTGEKFFINNSATDTSGKAPVYIIGIAEKPKVRENIPMTYEEELDYKRQQARDLAT